MRLLELQRRSHNCRRGYTQVWSHRRTAHITLRPDILKYISTRATSEWKNAFSSKPVPLCVGQESQIIYQCEDRQKHQTRTQKKPLLQPELPYRPWERLSSVLCEYKGQQFLLLSDHYSMWINLLRQDAFCYVATLPPYWTCQLNLPISGQ